VQSALSVLLSVGTRFLCRYFAEHLKSHHGYSSNVTTNRPRDPRFSADYGLGFKKARLSDADDNEIFIGQVIVRILTAISPVALVTVARLLHPFEGYFVMNVQGTYGTPADCVKVTADLVHATNIQPHTKKHGQSKTHLLSLDYPSSLRSSVSNASR
jgi:hypothetical protein